MLAPVKLPVNKTDFDPENPTLELTSWIGHQVSELQTKLRFRAVFWRGSLTRWRFRYDASAETQ